MYVHFVHQSRKCTIRVTAVNFYIYQANLIYWSLTSYYMQVPINRKRGGAVCTVVRTAEACTVIYTDMQANLAKLR